jgi:hypothetical protein
MDGEHIIDMAQQEIQNAPITQERKIQVMQE